MRHLLPDHGPLACLTLICLIVTSPMACLRRDDTRVPRLREMAQERLLAKDALAAIGRLDAAVALQPDDPEARAMRAELLDRWEYPRLAEIDWNEALAAKPNTPAWRLSWADVMLQLDRPQGALNQLDRLPDPPPEPATSVLRGQALRQLGQLSEAEAVFREVLPQTAGHPEWAGRTTDLLARTLIDLHRLDEALAVCQDRLKANPEDREARRARATVLLAMRRFEDAREDAFGARRQWPLDAEAWRLQAEAERGLNDLEAAAKTAEQAVRLAGNDVAAFRTAAGIAQALGRYDDARDSLAEAYSWTGTDTPTLRAGVLVDMAGLAGEQNRWPEALEHARRAVQLDAAQAAAWAMRGEARLRMGHPLLAVEDLTQALDRDPQQARYYALRAEAFEALDRPDDAQADLSQAAALTAD